MELDDRTALVTGAGEGAEVVISGRHRGRGAEVVEAIRAGGGKARFVLADLGDLGAVQRLAAESGDADILVDNAAAFTAGPAIGQEPESFDESFATNVRGPFFLTAALAPGMLARGGGSIVNITTMAARIGMPGLSVYGATKAALESLTRTWAAELASGGVRVNSVAPGRRAPTP